ncbi:hypothetical protein [Cryobacterium cheniae]|nr:hypothetical protein [Cryobacterium cheniae]
MDIPIQIHSSLLPHADAAIPDAAGNTIRLRQTIGSTTKERD